MSIIMGKLTSKSNCLCKPCRESFISFPSNFNGTVIYGYFEIKVLFLKFKYINYAKYVTFAN